MCAISSFSKSRLFLSPSPRYDPAHGTHGLCHLTGGGVGQPPRPRPRVLDAGAKRVRGDPLARGRPLQEGAADQRREAHLQRAWPLRHQSLPRADLPGMAAAGAQERAGPECGGFRAGLVAEAHRPCARENAADGAHLPGPRLPYRVRQLHQRGPSRRKRAARRDHVFPQLQQPVQGHAADAGDVAAPSRMAAADRRGEPQRADPVRHFSPGPTSASSANACRATNCGACKTRMASISAARRRKASAITSWRR